MITLPKDLRTGKPVWSAYRVPRLPVSVLVKDTHADVVVIGAGISGAMIAQELAEAGLSVIILDRRGPMKGSTFATTALLQYEIDTPLVELAGKIGAEKAMGAWRRSKLGLESLVAKICYLDIPCGLKRVDALYLAGDKLDAAALKQERVARNLIGLQTGYLTQNMLRERYGLARRAALHSCDSVGLNPLHLTAGLLLEALRNKARLYAPAEVTDIKTFKRHNQVMTRQDTKITCKYVVFATGYEMPKMIHTSRHRIQSTWALATRRQPGALPEDVFIWEASDPYLYLRSTDDGRVICGGEDEEFSDEEKRDALIPQKIATLQRKLKKLLPQLDVTPEFAWAGSFGASSTGLPTIGKIPHLANCFAAMAYGGNGITFSRIAAEIIRAEICGQKDPDADLFAFPK